MARENVYINNRPNYIEVGPFPSLNRETALDYINYNLPDNFLFVDEEFFDPNASFSMIDGISFKVDEQYHSKFNIWYVNQFIQYLFNSSVSKNNRSNISSSY